MHRGLQPRPGGRRPPPSRSAGLPGDVVAELRSVAKPGASDRAIRHLERAARLLASDRPEDAIREARSAKSAAPRSAAVREILGLALYRAERWRDAVAEMSAYRRMSGRQDQNHIIADCHRALGHPEKAVPLAEEALRAQRVPDDVKAEAVVVAAAALADVQRYEEALSLLRRARTKDRVATPATLRIWYVTADVLARAGRREEALEVFRRIMRHDAAAFDVAERVAQLA